MESPINKTYIWVLTITYYDDNDDYISLDGDAKYYFQKKNNAEDTALWFIMKEVHKNILTTLNDTDWENEYEANYRYNNLPSTWKSYLEIHKLGAVPTVKSQYIVYNNLAKLVAIFCKGCNVARKISWSIEKELLYD
ncbi:hypothetical protein EON71_00340 [bacterium]|nr:MAG: hypothetical protein EON71_00340 [bacterium]